jgi:hypothetical protein
VWFSKAPIAGASSYIDVCVTTFSVPLRGVEQLAQLIAGSTSAAESNGENRGFKLDGGRLPRMDEDDDPQDEDDDPQPDAYSTLYDPLRGLRERWMRRLSWWQKALLVVGAFAVVVVFALLTTTRILP